MFSDEISRRPRRAGTAAPRRGHIPEWLLNGLLAVILFAPILTALYRLLH
jgi:hypothetical protein